MMKAESCCVDLYFFDFRPSLPTCLANVVLYGVTTLFMVRVTRNCGHAILERFRTYTINRPERDRCDAREFFALCRLLSFFWLD